MRITESRLRQIISEEIRGLLEAEDLRGTTRSQAQQQAAGIALSVKRGERPESDLEGASKELHKMSLKDLEKMARVGDQPGEPEKWKDLPEKLDETDLDPDEDHDDEEERRWREEQQSHYDEMWGPPLEDPMEWEY